MRLDIMPVLVLVAFVLGWHDVAGNLAWWDIIGLRINVSV